MGTSSRRGNPAPSVRRAASRLGYLPFLSSRPSMLPASSTAARSRPTTQPRSATGLSALSRVKDCLLRLLARRLRLLSNRRPVQQSALSKMPPLKKQHQPSRTVFHGTVPGLSCSPIGKINIDVLFRDKDHFCREAIGLRWWTWRALIMHCLAGLLWPSSWQYLTTPTSR